MCGQWLTRIVRGLGFQNVWARDGMFSRTTSVDSKQSRKKRALVVVDVQNDFISGSLSLCNCPSKHDGSEVVPLINKYVESPFWDIVAYSKDWHPPDHISFVTNATKYKPHADNKTDLTQAKVLDYCVFDVDGLTVEQVLWPAHCIQHSEGAELHKDLKVVEGGITIHKGMNPSIDSYSAFYDNERRSETVLRQVLQDNGISQVYICGIATDVCVNFTAFDCHSLGFETFVIEDCCRGVAVDKCDETIQKMRSTGIKILTTDDVLKTITEAAE